MRVGSRPFWRAFAAGLACGISGWALNSRFSFNLWDNFESFTPVTLTGHGLWLSGHVPVLDLHESLGQPLLGNAQSGLMYFPFTIGLALLHLCGISGERLPELMGVLHIALAWAGWDALLRRLGVREVLAFPIAAGLVGCGFFSAGATIWQHIGIEYGWFPWILWALINVIDGNRLVGMLAAFGAFWFMCAAGSHIQQLIYISINTGAFGILYAWSHGRLRLRWLELAIMAAWMAALSAPILCYSLALRSMSQRSGALPKEFFFESSLSPKNLLGFLTPFVQIDSNPFADNLSLFAAGGPWLLAGLLLWRRNSRWLWALLAMGLVFLDFSLGEHGLIYPWTYGIPVWSSFRWPFKFTFHWVMMFAVLAGLMLESEWPRITPNRRLAVALALALGPLLFALPGSTAAWLLWLAQLGVLVGMACLSSLTIPAAILYVSAAFWLNSEQPAHRYKEHYGKYGAEYFAVEEPEQNRIVPLSATPCEGEICTMQPLANFDSAMINGYYSLTGSQTGISAQAMALLASANAWGVVHPRTASLGVGRMLYRSLGVRYYLVSDRDLPHYQSLFLERGLRPFKQSDGWSLYEDPGRMALVNVPTEVIPVGDQILAAFFGDAGESGLRAFVKGLSRPIEPRQTRTWDPVWIPGRGLRFEVENDSQKESIVQAALFPWPFLRASAVGGQALEFYPSNGLATAIVIPPGHFTVEIVASLAPLLVSLLLAALAFVAGLAAAARFGGRPNEPVAAAGASVRPVHDGPPRMSRRPK